MIKSLKQKLSLLLILPVALLLFFAGVSGFIYVRKILIREWQEAAILKLERAAHYMDMRLNRPMEWIKMFHETAESRGGPETQELILTRLKNLEGVTKVELKWTDNQSSAAHRVMQKHRMGGKGVMQFHRARISEVTPPRYDAQTRKKAVTLISDFKDEAGRLVGRLEVSLGFEFLMQDIEKYGWWQSSMTCLVDLSGRYLAHSSAMQGRTRLGETKDPVELAVVKSMQEKPFGTHLGPGHPPKMVSGFYRLQQAPWVIVIFAPGEDILTPILEFRFYYALAVSFCIILILLLIQFVGGRMVRQIRKISDAARQVAKGEYIQPLSITTADEIGQLKSSFNTMITGLKERDFIRDTFGRYVNKEFARELLKRPEASRLGGKKRQVAVLMADIRGFTPMSELLNPEETIRILNHYFSHMITIIRKLHGIIVDFYGDGVLVFFDPLDGPVKPAAQQAIYCGLEMQREMERFNAEMKTKNLPEMQIGIGVNVGEVIVGNIGSEIRAKYGIVGSAVNITQRIQNEAKGREVIISDSAYALVKKDLKIKRSFSTRLKGVNGKVNLHVVEWIQKSPESEN